MMTTALIDTPPAVLAPALDAAARRYIAARTRSGDALLEAVAALADARQAAVHGEWGIFLAAVGLDDSRARALIRLHDACLSDPALADRVRSGWLSEAAARELLPAPADVRAAVLDQAEPPTLQDVREAKRAATPAFTSTPAAAPALPPLPALPDDWADATARANRLGLYLGMNMAGVFRLSNLSNSIDHQIEAWADVLKLLDRKEAAAAVATVRGVGGSIPRIDAGALGTLGTRLTETTDPRELATTYRAIGMLLAAGGVLPALPTRPRAPRSADVSEQLAYLGKLETYVEAIEDRLEVRG